MNERLNRLTDGKLPLIVVQSDWVRIAQHVYCVDKVLEIRDQVDMDAEGVLKSTSLSGVNGLN